MGFCTSDVFPPGQLVPLGSLGLEDGILLGFRSEMTRVRSSADCAFKPRRTLARNCFWESSFSAQRPSLPSSGESPEETQAGGSPASLPTAGRRRFASSLGRSIRKALRLARRSDCGPPPAFQIRMALFASRCRCGAALGTHGAEELLPPRRPRSMQASRRVKVWPARMRGASSHGAFSPLSRGRALGRQSGFVKREFARYSSSLLMGERMTPGRPRALMRMS